ncbi:hypothetical protein BJ138DRAFT_1221436 [Hygrophoropsis aurantiaca]|uniref:Uncharacterized protein n=1 Tax=Hygrophoropsis aurantiaca TaxID=72124 RepID=A0ACB8AJF0_9AGAM|nr:hypothetical protein BJ138DRAFT_1221436 [Hygrophoropsis aurantiaca]
MSDTPPMHLPGDLTFDLELYTNINPNIELPETNLNSLSPANNIDDVNNEHQSEQPELLDFLHDIDARPTQFFTSSSIAVRPEISFKDSIESVFGSNTVPPYNPAEQYRIQPAAGASSTLAPHAEAGSGTTERPRLASKSKKSKSGKRTHTLPSSSARSNSAPYTSRQSASTPSLVSSLRTSNANTTPVHYFEELWGLGDEIVKSLPRRDPDRTQSSEIETLARRQILKDEIISGDFFLDAGSSHQLAMEAILEAGLTVLYGGVRPERVTGKSLFSLILPLTDSISVLNNIHSSFIQKIDRFALQNAFYDKIHKPVTGRLEVNGGRAARNDYANYSQDERTELPFKLFALINDKVPTAEDILKRVEYWMEDYRYAGTGDCYCQTDLVSDIIAKVFYLPKGALARFYPEIFRASCPANLVLAVVTAIHLSLYRRSTSGNLDQSGRQRDQQTGILRETFNHHRQTLERRLEAESGFKEAFETFCREIARSLVLGYRLMYVNLGIIFHIPGTNTT